MIADIMKDANEILGTGIGKLLAWAVAGLLLLLTSFIGFAAKKWLWPYVLRLYQKWSNDRRALTIYSKLNNSKNNWLQAQGVITELRVQLDADRAAIYMLHNGGKFYSGEDIQRCTCVVESTKAGVAPVALQEQNVILSTMPEVIEGIINSIKSCEWVQVPELQVGTFKSRMYGYGIATTMRRTVTLGKRIVGFIAVDWNDKIDPIGSKKCSGCKKDTGTDCDIRENCLVTAATHRLEALLQQEWKDQ